MSQENTTLSGHITDIFAHRFVIATASGNVLADLGPKGAEQVKLKTGERVEVTGEMKPSELKVERFTRDGQAPITIEHPKKPKPGDHKPGDHKDAGSKASHANDAKA